MLAALSFFFWLAPSYGEYRVFLLEIRHVDQDSTRQVISTLDQYQYPEFYPVSTRELVTLIDHWMCYGRTFGHQPPCERPVLEEQTGEPEQLLLPRGLASPQ